MEILGFVVVFAAVLALVDALAVAFGKDSRESFDEDTLNSPNRSFASRSN